MRPLLPICKSNPPQYHNKLQAALNSRIDGRMRQGSKRCKRVTLTKKKQLKKIEYQIRDIESYTSRTCPKCGHRRKSKVAGRVFACTNKLCGFVFHRDGVGAANMREKYLGCGPVVGPLARPIGMRYTPRAGGAHGEKG